VTNFKGGLGRRALVLGVAAAPALGVARPARGRTRERNAIRRLLLREAADLAVDPALALAVAECESAFDPLAVSRVGARGVMQIMPATCRGEYALHPDVLWQPRLNIRMGLHFLGKLLERYQGQEPFALSYYNGGSRVGDLPNARIIPATRGYVDRVARRKRHYQAELDRHRGRLWAA
jgi:soluble lytic murein transglycosylase-like protein